MNCFFLHCHPISYFIIHVCNQKIDEHCLKWQDKKRWILKFSNFTISEKLLKSNVLEFDWTSQILDTNFLGLMCYTKIRKDENKLSIIDLTSYSQSDHILGDNSLQSVVKYVTILFSMWQEKLKIFMEWTVFSFIAILFLIS